MRTVPNVFTQLQNNLRQIVSEEVENAKNAIERRVSEIFGVSPQTDAPPRQRRTRRNNRRNARRAAASRTVRATKTEKSIESSPPSGARLTKQAQKEGRKVVVQFAKQKGKVTTPDLRKLQFFKQMSDNQIRNIVMPMVDDGILARKGERRSTHYIFVAKQKGPRSKSNNGASAQA